MRALLAISSNLIKLPCTFCVKLEEDVVLVRGCSKGKKKYQGVEKKDSAQRILLQCPIPTTR
jgi:hypothetical protein